MTTALSAQSVPKVVVFQQPGFPIVQSEPVAQATLAAALGSNSTFATLDELQKGAVLEGASLLVMPYGSAFPAAAWPAMNHYLQAGGSLLWLGGQPLRVPVTADSAGGGPRFTEAAPQDTYSRLLDFRHTYAAPLGEGPNHFAWRPGYQFLGDVAVQPRQVFVEEGRLQGLGYLDSADGTHIAAPVIVSDHKGARIVALPFQPEPGFWDSTNGRSLIASAARYAEAGATSFTIEAQYSALRPGERPMLWLHLRHAHGSIAGKARVSLIDANSRVVDQAELALGSGGTSDATSNAAVPFQKPMSTGVYTVRATWTPAGAEAPQEFAENGFVVEERSALENGEALASHGDFLSLGGKPFFPVGTNYFSTEANGWDFSGPRNAAVWENDFADMQRHGVNFVRTGVWMSNAKFVEPSTGEVNERFLRNVEAFLAAAHRHNIVVNFTCFAFSPKSGEPTQSASDAGPELTPPNPYLDKRAVGAEQQYVRSIVNRFARVPWLSYDLINEPSFSNPRVIFHGNVPNNDPAEIEAWHAWLETHYSALPRLADAWRVTPEALGSWDSVPLPERKNLTYDRYGDDNQVRALDYNLFAQDMFAGWVRGMIATIRGAGSNQLVNVGQDEGGVTDRLLNQFYATSGVAFTTNHTYWQDSALLWDSVAAKRPGLPNITGETGYQPAWNPDGSWRYDELTGTALEERKWALGFAAGSSGAVQWDWDREVDFGMQRSDGSAKTWQGMMRAMGRFATEAAPYATRMTLPDVALVLPQSLQLSVHNAQALEAQQTAVRVLYQRNRVEAYAVGEYQTDMLGTPKLILLPSASGLSNKAWADIESRVRAGAVLLISGPFSADPHMHAVERASSIGIAATLEPLLERDTTLHSPAGDLPLVYGGLKTTILDRAMLPGNRSWTEVALGQGKVLFSAYPLELNENLDSIAAVYAYALRAAGVRPTYTTPLKNQGILICPTKLAGATLYVLTSETETAHVSFRDTASGATLAGTLEAGRSALLLVDAHGKLVTSYGWHGSD
ncbi:beta-galactosidase [Acidipila sp. EB88]|uniref:beta-galactosidase n=1 Tax=Acidipila sp. EB88 TaxID=2305226 RepID=UPI0013153515|nr:beta-galactosidase [Acidipila sp. EB88]